MNFLINDVPIIRMEKIPEVVSTTETPTTTTTTLIPTSSSGLIDSLKSNPYFSAGFGLVGIGALLSILKRSTSLGYSLAQRHLTVSLELVSKDMSYNWTLKWINSQLKKRAQHISVQTHFQKNQDTSRINTSYAFEPSVGIHYFKYRNRWVRAERTREQTVDRNTGSPVETLKLTSLGRDTGFFQQMLLEARSSALSGQSGKMLIYHPGIGI